MDVDCANHNRGWQGGVLPDGRSATVINCDAYGSLLRYSVDPLCQGSRSVNVVWIEWCSDGVFPNQLVVTAHLFPEVAELPLEHVVLHFQSPTDKDSALEAKA